MDGIRPWLPLTAEAFPVAVVMLLAWRELRILKRLRLAREDKERAERAAGTATQR